MSLPTPSSHQAPPTKPLTDPAELLTLLGRMVICFVLAALTIALLMRRAIVPALFIGAISIFVQRITFKMWKRLRDERIVAETERASQQTASVQGEAAP